tara:strand:+ start:3782 stop:4489 length:708 start_codon:yes stop_codon:yes gene_type:complete
MAKKVLNENTIRRFMKLASLGPLSGTFINEAYGEEEEVDEGMLGSVVGGVEDMVTGARDEEELPGEEFPGEELPDEELPGDEEEIPEDNKEELARTALEAVAAAFTSLGVDVDVSGDEEELDGDLPEEDPLEGGDELGVEGPEVEEGLASMAGKAVGGLAGGAVGGPVGAAAGGALGGMAGDALADDAEEEDLTESIMSLLAKADIEVVDDDKLRESLVKKVATRVVKRLLKERS